ncbi:MAG: hypothetical protein AAGD04_03165 [Pseudomonadota bacterium]
MTRRETRKESLKTLVDQCAKHEFPWSRSARRKAKIARKAS